MRIFYSAVGVVYVNNKWWTAISNILVMFFLTFFYNLRWNRQRDAILIFWDLPQQNTGNLFSGINSVSHFLESSWNKIRNVKFLSTGLVVQKSCTGRTCYMHNSKYIMVSIVSIKLLDLLVQTSHSLHTFWSYIHNIRFEQFIIIQHEQLLCSK